MVVVAVLLGPLGVSASHMVGTVTNRPDPFGPLPARTTNIFWMFRSGYRDHVTVVHDMANTIRRRVTNIQAVAGAGLLRVRTFWDGRDDALVNCEPGTYLQKVKVSRTVTPDVMVPPVAPQPYFERIKDMAADRFGNIYVLDTGTRTVQKFDADGNLVWRYGLVADEDGGIILDIPSVGGLAVDTNSGPGGPYVYVFDQSQFAGAGRARVTRFDQSGVWMQALVFYNADDDLPTGGCFSARYNRVFAAPLSSEDVTGINAGASMTLWFQNTSTGFTNLYDVQTTDGPSDESSFLFGVNQTNLYRWHMGAAAPNSFPGNNPPLLLAGRGVGESRSITARSNRYLYIVGEGPGGHRIRCVTTNGTVIETRGSKGSGGTNFWSPTAVAWDPVNDRIWVGDSSNRRLVCYDVVSNRLRFRRKVVSVDSPYNLLSPMDVAVDRHGHVYVVDNGKAVVASFDEFGNFRFQVGGKGTGPGMFRDPRGVAVDEAGYIYVSDYGTVNGGDAQDGIQKFAPDGSWVASFDTTDPRGMASFVRNGSNFVVVACQTNDLNTTRDVGFIVLRPDGSRLQSFWANDTGHDYTDVEVDHRYNFYGVDIRGADTVDFFPAGSQGRVAEVNIAVAGSRAGIAVDAYGTVWTPNRSTGAIHARSARSLVTTMPLLFGFSNVGSGPGQMKMPNYCAIRMRELPGRWADLWVVDAGNCRLQKFTVNWESETVEPVTIVAPGAPTVTAAYPDASLSTNVVFSAGVLYAREGRAVFRVVFSRTMSTNIRPFVQYVTADGFSYTVGQVSYMGNTWIGTARVVAGHDGMAGIRVANAAANGTNLLPDPTFLPERFVIDTTPPSVTMDRPSEGYATARSLAEAEGLTEPFCRLEIRNWTMRTGGTVFAVRTNIMANAVGYWLVNDMPLQAAEASNFLTVRAVDRAGNRSAFLSPRRKVLSVFAVGNAEVMPATNRRLGDGGDMPMDFVWTADAAMDGVSVVCDVPSGWSAPSTNAGSPGHVRIVESYRVGWGEGPRILAAHPAYPRRFKLNISSVTADGYVRVRYGTAGLTMVSNSPRTALGPNEWVPYAQSGVSAYTSLWAPATRVSAPAFRSLVVPVVGRPVGVFTQSVMPATVVRGASGVPALRLRFVNSNAFHDARVSGVVVTVMDGAGSAVAANSRISSLMVLTNGVVVAGPFAASADPLVALDLSSAGVVVPAGGQKTLDVWMNVPSQPSGPSVRVGVALPFNLSVQARSNREGAALAVAGSFPLRSAAAVIVSNAAGSRLLVGVWDAPLAYAEAASAVVPLRLLVRSTNTNVNDAEVTRVYIQTRNGDGTPAVPASLFDLVAVRRFGAGTVYGQKVPEASGDTMAVDVAGLFVPQRSSVTLEVRVSLRTNFPVDRFRLAVESVTNIRARDRILFTRLSNAAAPGYVLPFTGERLPALARFRILHDTAAEAGLWEPVTVRAEMASSALLTNYAGSVTLEIVGGTEGGLFWTNTASAQGVFVGGAAAAARYGFVGADRGVVTLRVKDWTAETVGVRVRSLQGGLGAQSNNLVVSRDPDPPSPPLLVTPGSNEALGTATPWMVWTRSYDSRTAVRWYLVEVSSNGFVSVQRTNRLAGPSGTNWTVGPSLSEGSWWWRVAAVDWGGNVAWSVVRPFVVDAEPDILLVKSERRTNGDSFVAQGGGMADVVPGTELVYTVFFSNTSMVTAYGLLLRDVIASNLEYRPGSMRLDGSVLTDAVDGDGGDYGGTMPKSVTVVVPFLGPRQGGRLVYRAVVR